MIFVYSLVCVRIVKRAQINNIPALVQITAWHRPGDKPLSGPMMIILLTHIYASLGLNEFNNTRCQRTWWHVIFALGNILSFSGGHWWLQMYPIELQTYRMQQPRRSRNTWMSITISVKSYEQATRVDAKTSRVKCSAQFMSYFKEYYLLNMYLNATICHIIMAKSQAIVSY